MTNTEPLLHWTGHPLVDAGMAALTAFVDKRDPADVTEEDLEEFAEFAERAYFTPALSGYLTVLFTSNFMNPSWTPEKKQEYAARILRSFEVTGSHERGGCAFCGRPMVQRAYRDLMPMVGGRTMVNFFAQGAPGLAVCGSCLTALQALSVGAPFCSGRSLILSTASHRLLLRLVREWVADMRRLVSLVHQGGSAVPIRAARTRTVDLLIRVQQQMATEEADASVVVYHLSNSGQGPGIDVFLLPASVVGFVRMAQLAAYRADWDALSRRGWEVVKGVSAADMSDVERLERRNYLYEDLFRLPGSAPQFIRRYFLQHPERRTAVRAKQGQQPQQPTQPLRAVSWRFIAMFLKEVLNMERARIEAIRELADQLADEIHRDQNKRLFLNAFRIRSYAFVRRLLLDTGFRRLTNGAAPTITLDQFLEVFEEGEELERVDWRLAWDLVLIRVIERLYELRSPVIEDPDVQQEAETALEQDQEVVASP
jgi:CRISPR-associated protein Cst1